MRYSSIKKNKCIFLNYFPTSFLTPSFNNPIVKPFVFLLSPLLLLFFHSLLVSFLILLLCLLLFLILAPIRCRCLELQMAPMTESRLSIPQKFLTNFLSLPCSASLLLPLLLFLYLCAGNNSPYPAEADYFSQCCTPRFHAGPGQGPSLTGDAYHTAVKYIKSLVTKPGFKSKLCFYWQCELPFSNNTDHIWYMHL